MARMSRRRSKSGIYHIIMRGINRQNIFEDDEDCIKFIQTLRRYKKVCEYELYAYCLMGNHIHMLLMEGEEPLDKVMRRICSSFVLWYNRKYGRIGYLFQDRYKSEPVEDNAYFLTVLRYIYQNPVKAGLVASAEKYPWSNYYGYMDINQTNDTDFVLGLFNENRETAIKYFIEYINRVNYDVCLEIAEKRQIMDEEARNIIKKLCKIDHVIDLQKLEINIRNEHLRNLIKSHTLSIRQIERLTGISRGIIQRL